MAEIVKKQETETAQRKTVQVSRKQGTKIQKTFQYSNGKQSSSNFNGRGK